MTGTNSMRTRGGEPRSISPSNMLVALVVGTLPMQVTANWLLSCSSCVDQTYFADEKLKADVTPANTENLLEQIKRVQVQSYVHKEEEFFNKFFNRTQLGILAQDLRQIMPEAVALVPERRWTNKEGASMVNKEVLMIRDAHLLFSAVGALNHLAHDFDMTENVVEEHGRSLGFVKEEQELNKRKREDIMEQLLRTIATTEVLAKALQTTEIRFSELETQFALLREDSKSNTASVKARIADVEESITNMKKVLEKEAHADLVEKRKKSEVDLEKTKVLKEIEELRYSEEQKTIKLKAKEKKEAEEAIIAMHKEKIKYEQEKKLDGDLQTIKAQELSNLRQLSEKAKHEKEIKAMEVEQEKFRAQKELEQAVEKAKIEQEAKIKEIRENEDVHAREQKMKLEGQKQQVIVAIQATARIVTSWLQALYGSSQNIMYAIGSFLCVVIGIYFTREMATLVREQLNKRLGRPSLVRMTSKKTRLGEFWRLLKHTLTCCLCRKRAGHEFDDVVLHKTLEDQIFRLANATKNAKARGMPLLHIMFYGPPGTGKTMCAQRFAEYSGLEYAFMSGADVAPLEEQAVTELHKLFTWVHKSRKGVLLFIDEADAFLAVRNKSMSESLRNALTTMLYHTGTPTSQFLMVLATNRPGDLDPAVLDRIDESVEFGLPDLAERERMVSQYFNMYVTKPLRIKLNNSNKPVNKALMSPKKGLAINTAAEAEDDVDSEALKEVAAKLKTFSGREIAKLFTGLQTHICAHMRGGSLRTRSLKLTKGTLFEVVKNKVEEHYRTLDVLAKGYAYVHKEGSPSLPGTPHLPRSNPLSASGSRIGGMPDWQTAGINININNSNQAMAAAAGAAIPNPYGGTVFNNVSPTNAAFSREVSGFGLAPAKELQIEEMPNSKAGDPGANSKNKLSTSSSGANKLSTGGAGGSFRGGSSTKRGSAGGGSLDGDRPLSSTSEGPDGGASSSTSSASVERHVISSPISPDTPSLDFKDVRKISLDSWFDSPPSKGGANGAAAPSTTSNTSTANGGTTSKNNVGGTSSAKSTGTAAGASSSSASGVVPPSVAAKEAGSSNKAPGPTSSVPPSASGIKPPPAGVAGNRGTAAPPTPPPVAGDASKAPGNGKLPSDGAASSTSGSKPTSSAPTAGGAAALPGGTSTDNSSNAPGSSQAHTTIGVNTATLKRGKPPSK